jgi:RNA polymerase sigma-70 factor (ECF subfamily)
MGPSRTSEPREDQRWSGAAAADAADVLVGTNVSAALLEAVVRGDSDAVAHFILQITPRVRGMASRICGRVDGEDVAQSALLVIWRGVKDLRDVSALRFWIDRIVIQTSLAWIRREKRRGLLLRRWGLPGQLPWGQDGESTPCETLAMTGLLHSLPLGQRRLLLMRYVLELSVSEIAELTSIPEGTVRNRLLRSRKSLARAISRRARSRTTQAVPTRLPSAPSCASAHERRRDAA